MVRGAQASLGFSHFPLRDLRPGCSRYQEDYGELPSLGSTAFRRGVGTTSAGCFAPVSYDGARPIVMGPDTVVVGIALPYQDDTDA